MATLGKLTPGQILWSLEIRRMGNTTMRRKDLFRVKVIEVDPSPEPLWALCSWNGNEPRKWYYHQIKKLRVKEPQVKGRNAFGDPIY